MNQLLLIPDPRPLDERLGADFFREAPKRPGVYLMRDATDKVLYVGKAKNLQQRLRNYRIANPDRMPCRHLKLLRHVARIEFQFCPDESAALKRESKLLRSLKPKFNRAGVWPGKARFLTWRWTERRLDLAVMEVPKCGWRRAGPLGGNAFSLYETLSRLLWLAVNPDRVMSEIPIGWTRGSVHQPLTLGCGDMAEHLPILLDQFFWAASDGLQTWFAERLSVRTHAFERGIIEADLECLKEFAGKRRRVALDNQMALL